MCNILSLVGVEDFKYGWELNKQPLTVTRSDTNLEQLKKNLDIY